MENKQSVILDKQGRITKLIKKSIDHRIAGEKKLRLQ